MSAQSQQPKAIAPKGQREAIAHSASPKGIASLAVWYLGIDFGTTGVSAVVLNYSTGQRYPIYWSHELSTKRDELPTGTSQFTPHSSDEPIFRLPTLAYFGPAPSQLSVEQAIAPIVVGSLASTSANNRPGVFIENFKPYLNIGIPYYCPKRHQWEPTLQLPGKQLVSLYWVRQSLQALLATLTPNSTRPNAGMKVGAKGLEIETLTRALQQLKGVILGSPAAWGDTYRFNLREAVLEAKLVSSPEQIFFLEDAIASVLAGLPSAREGDGERGRQGERENFSTWRGGTLVINAGATTTELALVDLPDNLRDLTYSDFSLCSWPYAGNALDQDIFCQLLCPQLSIEQQQQLSLTDDLELPQPGQPDSQQRDRLALLLQSSSLGQALLKAAGCLKLILQHKEKFTLDLGKGRCTLTRLDLEDRVIQPFLHQLNQKLNVLLLETGISEHGIYQVLLLGGTANLSTLTKWIQKRLPNATLIQHTDSSGGSWVAAGLATLPVYPKVLNRLRQQYSDYFLLLELLRAFPETTGELATRPYSLEEIMQRLERRGLNTGACYEQLVRLVEGQLPEGLVPSITEPNLLSPTSKQNLLYSKITASTGLFCREGERLYRRNLQQQACLHQYLELALSGIYQKFEEPLILTWDT